MEPKDYCSIRYTAVEDDKISPYMCIKLTTWEDATNDLNATKVPDMILV